MYVYRLGQNNSSKTKREVLVTIEIIPDITNVSDLTQSIKKISEKKSLYCPSKINAGKITSIIDLDGNELLCCYINRVKYEINKYFNIIGYDYSSPSFDRYYLNVYQSIDGALNDSLYISTNYTGLKYKYYCNGKIQKKKYYFLGKLKNLVIYYNNQTNSIKHEIKYRQDQPYSEKVYNTIGLLSCNYTFNDKGKIIKHDNFDNISILPSFFNVSVSRKRSR
jgi:hypothetical protein